MRCRNCEYPLEQLVEHRCPECGTAFDPADPSSFDTGPKPSLLRAILSHCAVAYLASFIAVIVFRDNKMAEDFLWAAVLAAVATIIASPVFVLVVIYGHRKKEPAPKQG